MKSNMAKAKSYVFARKFDGLPKENDLQLLEEELPPIKNGEFLAEAVYLSVDPYQRAYSSFMPTGTTFIGSQVAKVVESKNPKYPVGIYVVGELGWRTHTVVDDKPVPHGFPKVWIIPDPDESSLSLSLGILGMPGNTAYFGFLEICKPKAGETVVVSGAAGAVGSHVGQLAKIKGCTVIGIAGSDEKGKWLVEELKFDHFINYKDPDFDKKLEELTSEGVDCYFDNVGGEITTKVIRKMNLFGRISVCGSISMYNETGGAKANINSALLVRKQLQVEGFIFHRWLNRWSEGIKQNKEWIKEGKLKYRETVTEGFENMFKAFVDMLQGGNYGKAVVKV